LAMVNDIRFKTAMKGCQDALLDGLGQLA
jgi:hypothetical protein